MKNKYILLIILLIFPIFIFAETDKIEFFNKKIENISIYSNETQYNYFYKVDEDGNIIDNAEFILRDKDEKLKYDVLYDNSFKAYKYLSYIEEDYQKLLSILPSNVKDIVSNFRKMEDFTPYINYFVTESTITIDNYNKMYLDCDHYYDREVQDADIDKNYPVRSMKNIEEYDRCYLYVPTVMFIEEVKTPKGFEKEIAVLPATISAIYDFDQETREVMNVDSSIDLLNGECYIHETGNCLDFNYYYKYDNTLDYDDIESVYNAFANYDDSMIYPRNMCALRSANPSNTIGNNTFYNIKRLASDELELGELQCTPIIVDKKGKSNVSINSYVNSKEEINMTESSNVEIKVFLKNSGKAPSYENKVVSNVPEGVEYVDGSATDDGVYDSEKKTVTWDLDYLDANSGYMFSYNVSVSTGNKESVYVVTSSVSNEENTESIVSNEARVTTPGMGSNDTEEVENPKTGDNRGLILVVILIISLSTLYYFNTKKQYEL